MPPKLTPAEQKVVEEFRRECLFYPTILSPKPLIESKPPHVIENWLTTLLLAQRAEVEKAREEERERCIQAVKNPITDWGCTANLEDGDAHNHKTITVCRAVASIKAIKQSELDQPTASDRRDEEAHAERCNGKY